MLEARLLETIRTQTIDKNKKVLQLCEANKEAKLGEMIVQNSKQLIDVIKSEMKTSPNGFELGIIELLVVHLILESIISILIQFVVFDPR